MNDEGLSKSAVLLMSLGEEEAAEVMKFLSPKEVQKLGQTMAKLKSVTRERIDTVLLDATAATTTRPSATGTICWPYRANTVSGFSGLTRWRGWGSARRGQEQRTKRRG